MSDGTHLWEAVRDEALRRGADPDELRRLILAHPVEGGAGWRWWYEEKTTPELAAWLLEQLPPAPQGEEPMETTLQQRLAEPFGLDEVEFRAGATSGNRALALAYIDARVVMDRLDGVLGCENWQDHYEALPSGCVKCVLSLRLGGEWVSKEDVGGPSDQKDVGDHTKAAFSDALKRAAVKFGVGRYLYSLPAAWTDYDPQKKQLLRPPQLPAWALPAKAAAKPAPQAAPAANGHGSAHALPATADELSRRLSAKDKAMTEAGLCRAGELVRHVHAVITAERLAESVVKLDPKHFGRVAEAVREFEGARAPAKAGAA